MTEQKIPAPVFDAERRIEIKLQTPEGVKAVTVRFPSDEELVDRARRRKIIIKQIGRGTSETVVPEAEDVDAALFEKIREGEGPDLDVYEASQIIEQLTECEVDDVLPDPEGFRVVLRVPGATTAIVLRMPTAKEIIHHKRSFAKVLDLPYNRQSVTVNLQAAADLFVALKKRVENYAGAVPINHQAVAVKAAIDALEAGLGAGERENF